MADASSRLTTATFKVGATYRIVGFVGQRATRSGAPDGYRIWIRDAADVALVAGPAGAGARPPRGRRAATATPPVTVSIVRALRITDRAVAIDAVVTAPATLLDATGRRIVVQDASAAIELLLPDGLDRTAGRDADPCRGPDRRGLRRASTSGPTGSRSLGSGAAPAPVVLHGSPGEAQEWRLVTITGRVDERPQARRPLARRDPRRIADGRRRRPARARASRARRSSKAASRRSPGSFGGRTRTPPISRFAVTPRFAADVPLAGQATGRGRPTEAGAAPGTSAAAGCGRAPIRPPGSTAGMPTSSI